LANTAPRAGTNRTAKRAANGRGKRRHVRTVA
jgi:hypothetical protein